MAVSQITSHMTNYLRRTLILLCFLFSRSLVWPDTLRLKRIFPRQTGVCLRLSLNVSYARKGGEGIMIINVTVRSITMAEKESKDHCSWLATCSDKSDHGQRTKGSIRGGLIRASLRCGNK